MRQYEYKKVRVYIGWFMFGALEKDYPEVINRHAEKNGWRFVQIFRPPGALSQYCDLIFEKEN